MIRSRLLALTAAVLATAAAAMATETITCTYDARGRLAKVERKGSVNDNVKSEYKYDKADNRTNVTLTSPNPPPPQ
jgi:YD repeat-containing protein